MATDGTSDFPPSTCSSDWLTTLWPSGRHHAADSRCCITAGPHWFMSKCLRGPTVCLLCTYSAKKHEKGGKTQSLVSIWGTPKIPQSLSPVKKEKLRCSINCTICPSLVTLVLKGGQEFHYLMKTLYLRNSRSLSTGQNDNLYQVTEPLWGLCNIIRRWLTG